MKILKLEQITKMTWFALGLLFVTYIIFGWLLFKVHLYFLVSGIIIAIIWFVDLFFTFPLNRFKGPIIKWFKSDYGAFSFIVLGSISIVVMMTWLEVFTTVLIMLSATALARLEMQTARFKNWQAFLTLALISTVGLGLGWSLNYFWDRR